MEREGKTTKKKTKQQNSKRKKRGKGNGVVMLEPAMGRWASGCRENIRPAAATMLGRPWGGKVKEREAKKKKTTEKHHQTLGVPSTAASLFTRPYIVGRYRLLAQHLARNHSEHALG